MAALVVSVLGTNPWGKRFLEKNRYNEGVTTQPSGLQYKVRRRGGGDAHPLPSTQCDVHYVGRVAKKVDGKRRWTTFDNSRKRGEPAPPPRRCAVPRRTVVPQHERVAKGNRVSDTPREN